MATSNFGFGINKCAKFAVRVQVRPVQTYTEKLLEPEPVSVKIVLRSQKDQHV